MKYKHVYIRQEALENQGNLCHLAQHLCTAVQRPLQGIRVLLSVTVMSLSDPVFDLIVSGSPEWVGRLWSSNRAYTKWQTLPDDARIKFVPPLFSVLQNQRGGLSCVSTVGECDGSGVLFVLSGAGGLFPHQIRHPVLRWYSQHSGLRYLLDWNHPVP